MRFLEFIHKVDEDVLLEAAKDRYMQMFQNIPDEVYAASKTMKEKIPGIIKNTMTDMKRADRITWALRLIKYHLLDMAKTNINNNTDEDDDVQTAMNIIQYVTKEQGRMSAKSGLTPEQLSNAANSVASGDTISRLVHFISLPINEIQNYTFAWQNPVYIIHEFQKAEREWQEARAQEVSHSEDYEGGEIEPIIQFPDGSAWFDLKRNACDVEAGAMGHCGNRADAKESHTVLSYRTPVKGTDRWVPHMTFILDKEHGTLGEMKGRGNEKPAEKYHPYIVELLKKPYVKGFGPGGYEPQNNFSLDDLPPEQAEALKEMKPGFRSPIEQYKKEGMTDALATRIIDMVQEVSGEKTEYVEENDEFIVDSYKNLNQAVEFLGGDTAKWIAGILDGSTHIDFNTGEGIDDYELGELLDLLPPEILQKISLHIENEYGGEYEDDLDYNRTRDMALILDAENDPIADELRRAISDGREGGAENEMYEAFQSWIKDLSSDYNARIEHEYDEGGATLRIDAESLAEMVSDEDDKLYDIENEGWKEALDIKDIEEPHYGWQGYDEETAKERFIDEFDEDSLNLTPQKEKA